MASRNSSDLAAALKEIARLRKDNARMLKALEAEELSWTHYDRPCPKPCYEVYEDGSSSVDRESCPFGDKETELARKLMESALKAHRKEFSS